MSQNINLNILGLYSHPNKFSQAPTGALLTADNVVIDKELIAETRRGHKQYGDVLTVSSGMIDRLFEYKDKLITHYNNKLAYDSDGAGTWVEYSGTYDHPDTGFKMRSVEGNKNLYFTTDVGVKKLDSITATPIDSGAYKALGGTAELSGVSGFMTDDTAVAYRLVWAYYDANNNLILGSPSQRLIITNSTGGSRDVSLTFVIPDNITTSWLFQIYRSTESATAAITPDDELQLVYEDNPTSGDITAQSLTIIDSTQNNLKGAALYTNQGQQTILQTNDQPPYCKDLTVFKNHTFYANTKTKHRYRLDLIGVGSPDGLQGDDTITIAGTVYTARSLSTFVFVDGDVTVGTDTIAETTHGMNTGLEIQLTTTGTLPAGLSLVTNYYVIKVDDDSFKLAASYADAIAGTPVVDITAAAGGGDHTLLSTSGENINADEFYADESGTPAQNIDTTAISLIKVINKTVTQTDIYGYYLSGYEDIPGYILIEERAIGGASFAVISSRSTCWNPKLPSSGTTESSDNEESPNRIYISKIQQPEAVPLINYIDIGSADKPIKRIIALRDSVMVLKDDGIFRITGTTLPFASYPFNDSVKLKANESAVLLDNKIFAMTDQGVVAIHDSGIEIVSRPIEHDLIALLSDLYTNFEDVTFGISYESDRRYCLFTVTETSDTYATQAWTYNTITQSWTRWTTPRSAGYVKNDDDKLYLGHPTNDFVYQERKTRTTNDFADEEYTVNVVSSSGTTVVLSSSSLVTAGMSLLQSNLTSKVISVDNATDITVSNDYSWSAGAATVNEAISTTVTWTPQSAENPAILKHWRESSFIFDDAAFTSMTANFSSNFVGDQEVTLTPISSGGIWGQAIWGQFTWGGQIGGSTIMRTFFPREVQRSHWVNIELSLNEAFTSFSVAGVSVFYNDIGPKTR